VRVAIVEYRVVNHAVMILNWINICKRNGWSVCVYTSEDCFLQISDTEEAKYSKLTVRILEKYNFVSALKLRLELRRFERVIYTSVYDSYLFFFTLIALSKNSYLTVHNASEWVSDVRQEERSIKECIKSALRKYLVHSVHSVIVNSSNMRGYCTRFNANLNYLVVPFSMKQRAIKYEQTTSQKVVVYPGIVSLERKKYDKFLNLAKANPESTFYLLGKVSKDAEQVVNRIVNEKIANIIYFDGEYVPQIKYDEIMTKATLLFSDINVEFGCEVYGISKDSGVSYMMSEYALPLLVNSDFNNIGCLDTLTTYFNDEQDLNKKFKSLNEEKCRKIARQISFNRECISLESISKDVREAFCEV
jgi:hypothetical protein